MTHEQALYVAATGALSPLAVVSVKRSVGMIVFGRSKPVSIAAPTTNVVDLPKLSVRV
jgi:hypothetical protein